MQAEEFEQQRAAFAGRARVEFHQGDAVAAHGSHGFDARADEVTRDLLVEGAHGALVAPGAADLQVEAGGLAAGGEAQAQHGRAATAGAFDDEHQVPGGQGRHVLDHQTAQQAVQFGGQGHEVRGAQFHGVALGSPAGNRKTRADRRGGKKAAGRVPGRVARPERARRARGRWDQRPSSSATL
ncbi:MAG: hypothetical protein R3F17_05055 [Planctomycetota bacterium]